MARCAWPLLLLLGSAGCDGCGRRGPPAPVAVASAAAAVPAVAPSATTPAPAALRELTWSFEQTPVGAMQVVLLVPAATEPLPVLIAFHGRGEAFKGVARGARGWIDDYRLDRAIRRVAAPPLAAEDFSGLVDPERLEQINAELRQRAYGGLIVACPYTPDILAGDRGFELATPLAGFVVDQLLPRIAEELGGGRAPPSVGIDGVSLGGRAALLVGFERPEAFRAVGSLQAAFDTREIPELTRRALAARRKHPELSIRLLTSRGDFFRNVLTALSQSFERAGVAHRFDVVAGPHDYAFNRGPGAYEMLLFHDRALRD